MNGPQPAGGDARSWLFTPGDHGDRFGAAADISILDLEDAVAPDHKQLARTTVTDYLNSGGRAWVRVNGTDTGEWAVDLDAVAGTPGLAGIVLSKSETPHQLTDTAARARTPVLALIETAAGVENAAQIAAAPGVLRLAFGSADFCRELRISSSRSALLYARSRLVVASAAAGLPGPIDGPTVALDDLPRLQDDLDHARELGFTGKFCLHPGQVTPADDAFTPSPQELSWARRVVDLAGDSAGAAMRVDGEMIDRPRLDTARRLLARAELFGTVIQEASS